MNDLRPAAKYSYLITPFVSSKIIKIVMGQVENEIDLATEPIWLEILRNLK